MACTCALARARVQIPMLGSEGSADEDEEDSIWSDLRDRSLADARKRRGLSSRWTFPRKTSREKAKLLAGRR